MSKEQKPEDDKKKQLSSEEQTKKASSWIDLSRKDDVNTDYRKLIDILSDFDKEKSQWINEINLPKTITWFDNTSIDKQLTLEQEINDLKKKLRASFSDLNQVTSDKEQKIEELRKLKEELQSKEKISHILPRICEEARQKLLSDNHFRDLFHDAKSCECVVVSIDIRRSTELMLKARKPDLFSKFITELSQKLSEVILTNFGIFDKFTGDGILAFFPIFYSGEHAIIRAVKAAEECHKVFIEHYKNSRECFNVFIKDVGLGIGIDYGTVTLVNTRNELTVVGIPVVYACRMGGAKAGETLLNQPAKEEISRLCDNYIKVTETELNIKNEGTALAYLIEIHKSSLIIPKPEWTMELKTEEKELSAIQ
jgi:class 3 adenylate cyclase